MFFTEKEKIEILDEFIGGRHITDKTLALYKDKFEKIEETIYRGMPFYKGFIKPGKIIEEWYDASHWTLDFNIARGIFSNDYVNDDYIEELSNELNISFDETYDSFVPMVMRMNGVSQGARTYEIVKDLDVVSKFYKEMEITTMGIDTIITNVELKTDEKGDYYLVDVKEVSK